MGILSVGISGLNAAQAGLLTTSHNISNASTPGYSRQEIVQGTNTAMFTGAGFVGQGTHVATVRRVYDEFLARQVLSTEAGAAEMQSYQAQISQIEYMLADTDAGLSPVLSGFFKGVQDVSANPSSVSARQSMISAAQALTARFQGMDQRFTEIRGGVNQQITAQIAEINTYTAQVADINQRIIVAQTSGTEKKPNDLLDQRAQALRELNKIVRVTTVEQSDGSTSIFIGSGQALLVGNQLNRLQATRLADDTERVTVGIVGVSGAAQIMAEAQVTGGSLAGLLGFRSQTLDLAQNSVGRIALTLAQTFNDRHMLGQDLTGNLGQQFFSTQPPLVRASSLNTGSGVPGVGIDAASIAELTTSDYRLSFTGGNYRLTRLADNQVQTFAALPQTVDGMTISIGAWLPNANDSVLIQPTRGAAHDIALAFTDARMVAAAAPVRSSAALGNAGTARISAGTVNGPPPTDPNLRHKVSITFTSATSFDVVDITAGATLASGMAYTTGADISYNGWTAQISGNPVAGDVFTLESNVNGVSDNRNAALLGGLQTRNTMNGGSGAAASASYQSAYAQLVSAIGSKGNEVEAIGRGQQVLADQFSQSLQSASGVNLDEEAANLLRYQQAYQASAKVLEIANRVFDEIIALGR